MPEWKQGDTIRITHYAEATWAVTLTDWEKVAALEPLHIYSEQTVRDRFNWESGPAAAGSIHLAPVRIRQLAAPWELSYEPKYGGCRSWINLPAAPVSWEKLSIPVVGDREFEGLLDQLKTLIDPAVISPNQTAPF